MPTKLENPAMNIANATGYKNIALVTFLDTEGASDRILFDVITQAAERHSTEPATCRWICSMQESRNMITILSRENLRGSMARGHMQRADDSPLLWSLVVDEHLWGLNDDYYTIGYADNTAIPINRKFLWTCQR
jgi:hypothetical protein